MQLYKHQQQSKDQNRCDIKGYEGLYEVDRVGNVYSKVTTRSRRKRMLKPYQNGIGYLKVTLYKNKKQKKHYVHRLVAEAFIAKHPDLPEVNHIDGNRSNNAVENLEWCNRSQNVKHTYDVGGRLSNRETHIGNNYNGKQVIVIDAGEVHKFESMKKASNYIGKYDNYVSESFRRTGKNKIVVDGKKVMIYG